MSSACVAMLVESSILRQAWQTKQILWSIETDVKFQIGPYNIYRGYLETEGTDLVEALAHRLPLLGGVDALLAHGALSGHDVCEKLPSS